MLNERNLLLESHPSADHTAKPQGRLLQNLRFPSCMFSGQTRALGLEAPPAPVTLAATRPH